ncbi:MAG: hypothetical protein WCR21_10420, partial [Bacteroidota bacterium]
MKKSIFSSVFVISALLSFSQEGIRSLTGNLSYYYKTIEHAQLSKPETSQQAKGTANSLFIPFKEDFFYACNKAYPDMNLWADSNVYVNTGYPIAPPSIGVATFDGLNKHGYPYTPNLLNLSQSLSADTLTSRPINLAQTASSASLQPSDSLALSFYFQARGNGEPPESNDSLLLDFYMPSQKTWTNGIWYSKGSANSNTNDTVFKRVFIWIKDTAYLRDGFKFRIRNTATTAGDFDHWHVDYIYLDKNRSILGDTIYNDLTFANVPTPFLKNYSAMPYEQYDSTEMATKLSVRIKNNSATYINQAYDFKIYNQNNQQINHYAGGPINLCPFKPANISACTGTLGYSTYPAHANPTFNYSFSPLTDSADFRIQHYLSLTGNSTDFFKVNDTIYQYQKFRNYFALDDGNAEGGYYVNGTGGKMAMKFKINYFDTLQAVRIYFDPVGSVPTAASAYSFNIMLWSDGGNGPGTLIFTDKVMYPVYYKTDHKEHPEYQLTVSPGLRKLGPGSYYIGFQQKIASGITVGFDKNIDHKDKLYYDSGSGWTQSSIPGSIMIHPVFGKKVAAPVSISERSKNNLIFTVYPNPSNDFIYLSNDRSGNYS